MFLNIKNCANIIHKGGETMIRLAIVEDNEQYIYILKNYIERYEKETDHIFKIAEFNDGKEIINTAHGYFDIILMDIEMNEMNGMEAARIIRKKDQEVVLIFITQAPQYAMNGFEVDALDYVLKPINYYAFTQRLERAIARYRKRELKSIMIETGGILRKVPLSSIRFIEVSNHDACYYLLDETIIIRESLKSAEKKLNDIRFFKTNQSFIVNCDFIESVHEENLKIGKHTIPISRSRKKLFLDHFNNYLNEVSK